jgi:hypothetical protein
LYVRTDRRRAQDLGTDGHIAVDADVEIVPVGVEGATAVPGKERDGGEVGLIRARG